MHISPFGYIDTFDKTECFLCLETLSKKGEARTNIWLPCQKEMPKTKADVSRLHVMHTDCFCSYMEPRLNDVNNPIQCPICSIPITARFVELVCSAVTGTAVCASSGEEDSYQRGRVAKDTYKNLMKQKQEKEETNRQQPSTSSSSIQGETGCSTNEAGPSTSSAGSSVRKRQRTEKEQKCSNERTQRASKRERQRVHNEDAAARIQIQLQLQQQIASDEEFVRNLENNP